MQPQQEPAPDVLQVKVYSPFKTYYEGPANSVSAVNQTGPFDILGQHKNFISLLIPSTLVVRMPPNPDFSLQVERGLMHVKKNRVQVFLDI